MAFQPVRNYSKPGTYPDSEHVLRHLYRNRADNKLAPAFTKVQGRVLVDIDRIQSLLAQQAEQQSKAGKKAG